MLSQFNPNDIQVPTTGHGLINLNSQNLKLGDVIYATLPFVYGAAGLALLIYFVIGGLQLMLSKGDPKAIQSAQAKITSAIIGFVIIIIAYLLTALLGQLLGIKQFGNIFS